MKLKSLELENFGPFSGKNTLVLEPVKQHNRLKPLIIFGGKNGSGKTTLLEAVKVCLYGDAFPGRRMQRSAYYKFLRQHLHRFPDGTSSNDASISLDLDYARLGTINSYRIKRSWRASRDDTVEKFEIWQDGKTLRDVDEEQWQHFVLELVPLGMSRLFFFDGEQVQSLAESEADNRHLLKSIDSLLGLDIVERLQNDLRIYLSRRGKAKDVKVFDVTRQLQDRIELLEQKLDATNQEKAQAQGMIDRVEAEIEEQEQQLSMEGGGYARKREELRGKKKELERSIELATQEIRDLCSNLFPFALVPDLCVGLRNRLWHEEVEQQRAATLAFLERAHEDLNHELETKDFLNLVGMSREQKSGLIREIISALKDRVSSIDRTSAEVIHSVSPAERAKLQEWINQALDQVPSRMRELSATFETLARERQTVEALLYRVPTDDVTSPLIQEIGRLHEELGVFRGQAKVTEENESKATNELELARRKLDKSLLEEKQLRKLSERLQLVARIQPALDEYVVQSRKGKIEAFSQNFLSCLNSLYGKKGYVKEVKIDSDNYSIVLRNSRNVSIPKSELSAGEKQIYAIAMLWALAKTSGRPLPFIVDTPLGRLDAKHRENIVENFFPNASHQVIVLSTDTEIDKECFGRLKPYVCRAYWLDYDVEEGATRASEGYF